MANCRPLPTRIGYTPMTFPKLKKQFTPAEYYGMEANAAYKSDYYEGEIFDMSGGTSTHSLISANICGELRQRLKGKPCVVYESNLRLKVQATGLRTYPDVNIYCDEVEFDEEDPGRTTAVNPTVVFEVASPTTEEYDRNFKSQHYRRIPSLKAYVLVAQSEPLVEYVSRQADGTWSHTPLKGLDAVLALEGIDVQLPLAEVYANVKFAAGR